MDEHIKEFFSQYSEGCGKGNFHKVIALHETPDIDWETIQKVCPSLPKGWFELCQFSSKDRIQFKLDFWMSKLPFHPNLDKALSGYFGQLDDIGVFLFQKKSSDAIGAQMIYSLSDNRGFYRGSIHAKEEDILGLQKLFPETILPTDYLAFLEIHNGFCKATDSTGITSAHLVKRSYDELQAFLESQDNVRTKSGKEVDPRTLIPFYESFGMPYYQCFWGEWHPEQEMGNVYYSAADNTVSDPLSKYTASLEHMAFPTFVDWLVFYLEQVEY